MKMRTFAAVATTAALALTACGGGSKTMTEDDFLDALADLCDNVQGDVDDIDAPASLGDMEDFAKDVGEVYADARADLAKLSPPKSLAADFKDFLGVIDDQIDEITDLEEAAADEDEEEVTKILERVGKLADDQAEIADDLGVPECGNQDEPTDTTPDTTPTDSTAPADVTTTTAGTEAPTTTEGAPLTLPPTLPPATLPPGTTIPAGAGFTVLDVATVFIAPAGYQLISSSPDEATMDLLASFPDLNSQLGQVGVATLALADGTEIADIWIGLAISEDPGMPLSWLDIDCPDGGTPRTSPHGVVGVSCPGSADSPTYEIFSAVEASVGISVYTLVPDMTSDQVADLFLDANAG